MKIRFLYATFLLSLSLTPVVGQSEKDIQARYGRAEDVYSVAENIWMTPAYDANGKVCSMRLYPKRLSREKIKLGDQLQIDEVLRVINELVPARKRGSRKDGFGMTDIGGGIGWTHFNYDHISFTFISSIRLEGPPIRTAGEPVRLEMDEKSLLEARLQEARLSDDDLIRKYTASPRVLEIKWENRKCVER